MLRYRLLCCCLLCTLLGYQADVACACTSAIVSGRCTPDGRPLLWKNRDTGTLQNFVDKVCRADSSSLAYVALFNAGDTLREQAWIGVNEASFAIMNTASYNLAPDTARVRDREGYVMAEALGCCRTLADFEHLLDTLPRPLGVQANFGVVDAAGQGAFYETCDTGYVRFLLADSPTGVLIRTNFSVSGKPDGGYGYIRYENAEHLIEPAAKESRLTPRFFTDTVSCSFYHSLYDADVLGTDACGNWITDQDFIPRHSTSASVVIVGHRDAADTGGPVMWCALGYPPCAVAQPCTVDSVAPGLLPDPVTGLADACVTSMKLKEKIFPVSRGSGQHYINTGALKEINDSCRKKSDKNYIMFKFE